jgi:orotidine-5'-phosphate decarboxylase
LSQGLNEKDPRERLIVALDVSTTAAARQIVAAVGDSALTYKVGMQLYTAEGPWERLSAKPRNSV